MSTQYSPKLFQNIPVCFSLSQLRYLCEWLLYSLLVGLLGGKPDETSNLPAISPVSFNVLICNFGRYQVGIPWNHRFHNPTSQQQCEVEEYEILGITPWKINMKPTNHPFRKEHDLPNPHVPSSMLIFRGVSPLFPRPVGYPSHLQLI